MTYDNLEVFIVDFYTLQTVNSLCLVHDIVLHCSRTFNSEDIVRSNSTIRQCYTSANIVTFLYQDLLSQWDEIRLHFTLTACDRKFAVTAFDFTKGYFTINFCNDSRVRRVTCLEELRYTWQTTGNIASSTERTGDCEEEVADLNLITISMNEYRFCRQVIGAKYVTTCIYDRSYRHFGLITCIGDINLFLTGLLIGFRFSSNAFDDVFVMKCTSLFEHERSLIRVPFANDCTLIIYFARSNEELGSVRNIEGSEYYTCIFVHKTKFVQTANNDCVTRLCSDSTQVFYFDTSMTRNSIGVFGCSITSDTTRVEGTQCQLSTRLTDSLCSNNADSFTFLNHLTCSKVTSIALSANTMFSFAGKNRADFHFIDTSSFNRLALCFANFFTSCNDKVSFVIQDVMYRNTTKDTLSECSDNGIVLFNSTRCQSTECTAIFLSDNHVV